jgi:N-acetyl-gamma-glutamylphosphate reductase
VLDDVSAPDEATEKLLLGHPCVSGLVADDSGALRFSIDTWKRQIDVGQVAGYPSGLLELMDNNPIVCADRMGVPSAGGTLALIALGPLVEAGILVESPTMLTNAPSTSEDVEADLLGIGWTQGLTLASQSVDLDRVYAATVIAAIQTLEDLTEIDDLYDERYGRSFFVRRDENSEWDISLVQGKPFATYRLRIAPDSPISLLTIQVMADRDGKCGAAQLVHAMNVMCGFEESLGIAN